MEDGADDVLEETSRAWAARRGKRGVLVAVRGGRDVEIVSLTFA